MSVNKVRESSYLPHESGLLEIEFHLLSGVQVVQDNETTRLFVCRQVSEVDRLSREGSHASVLVEVSSAERKIFVELGFDRLGSLEVVALTTKTESVSVR